MKARDLITYGGMAFILLFFFVGFTDFLLGFLSKDLSVTISGVATFFSIYFFKEIKLNIEKELRKRFFITSLDPKFQSEIGKSIRKVMRNADKEGRKK